MLIKKDLEDNFDYDKERNIFVWKTGCRKGKNAGFIGGKNNNISKSIALNGRTYPESKLIWLFYKNEYPDFRLLHVDGNPLNNRIENLKELYLSKNKKLDYELLVENFKYDKNTGKFYLLKSNPFSNKKFTPGCVAGHLSDKGYIRISFSNKDYFAHRLAWLYIHGEWPTYEIDHINGVRNDNRLCNLREAKPEENAKNRITGKNNTSGFKGITFNKKLGKWSSRIAFSHKRIYLGAYDKIEDAADAYRVASIKYHKKFSKFNISE